MYVCMYVCVQCTHTDLYIYTYMHIHTHTYNIYACIYTQRGWSLVFEVLRALVKRSTRKEKERKGAQGKEMEGAQGSERKGAQGKDRVGTG